MGTNGVATAASVDKTNLWGSDMNKIVALGPTGNALYAGVNTARADAINADPSVLTPAVLKDISTLPANNPAYVAALQNAPVGKIEKNNKGKGIRPLTTGATMKLNIPNGSGGLTPVFGTITKQDNNGAWFTTPDGKSWHAEVKGNQIEVISDSDKSLDTGWMEGSAYEGNG